MCESDDFFKIPGTVGHSKLGIKAPVVSHTFKILLEAATNSVNRRIERTQVSSLTHALTVAIFAQTMHCSRARRSA